MGSAKKIGILGFVGCGLLLHALVPECEAKVDGACYVCHTMHNSQDGSVVAATHNEALLNSSCIACHTGTNTSGSMPFVLTTSGGGPTYGDTGTTGNSLAGGNFYWPQLTDAFGHNVSGISGEDSRLGLVPPGGSAMDFQLKCAGIYGCHGDRTVESETEAMLKSHHNNDMTTFKDGTTNAKSYRFLLLSRCDTMHVSADIPEGSAWFCCVNNYDGEQYCKSIIAVQRRKGEVK